jgi:Glutamine amidotransferases class-II
MSQVIYYWFTYVNSTGISGTDGVYLLDSGRLGPGEMISVNIAQGKFSLNDEVKNRMAQKKVNPFWFTYEISMS